MDRQTRFRDSLIFDLVFVVIMVTIANRNYAMGIIALIYGSYGWRMKDWIALRLYMILSSIGIVYNIISFFMIFTPVSFYEYYGFWLGLPISVMFMSSVTLDAMAIYNAHHLVTEYRKQPDVETVVQQ